MHCLIFPICRNFRPAKIAKATVLGAMPENYADFLAALTWEKALKGGYPTLYKDSSYVVTPFQCYIVRWKHNTKRLFSWYTTAQRPGLAAEASL